MLDFIKKYKFEIGLVVLIGLVYFALRLPNLTLQPIFADEAIYIRWAQLMKDDPTLRFVSLSDGKTPLFMWLLAVLFKFIHNPLAAGRVLSILSGFGTLLGVLLLGWKFFNKRTAFLAAFLIAVTPFMVFFDRMALVDSMLAMFSIWSLNLTLLVSQYFRIDLAMVLGYSLGAGILTKTPGMFSLVTLPVSVLLIDWKSNKRIKNLVKLCGLLTLSLVITFAIYNILKLDPNFHQLNSRDQDYIFSPSRLLKTPFDPFLPHLKDLADWLPKFLTWPLFLVSIAATIWTIFKKNKVALAILLWAGVPLVLEMLLLQTFTARYILFSIPPLLVISSWAINDFINKFKWSYAKSLAGFLVIFLIFAVYFDVALLTRPVQAPLPNEERDGYLSEWTAGYGLADIAQFLKEKSIQQPVVVGTDGSFGTLPEGLKIYLDKVNQVDFVSGDNLAHQLETASLDHPTYFVFNGSFPDGLPKNEIVLLKTFPKVPQVNGHQNSIKLFQVITKELSK